MLAFLSVVRPHNFLQKNTLFTETARDVRGIRSHGVRQLSVPCWVRIPMEGLFGIMSHIWRFLLVFIQQQDATTS